MKLYVRKNGIAVKRDFELQNIGGRYVLYVNKKATRVKVQADIWMFFTIGENCIRYMFGEYNIDTMKYYLRIINNHVFDSYLDVAVGLIAKQCVERLLY